MNISIGGYKFQGFYQRISTLDEKPGLYLIICDNDGIINYLDVGESENIRESVWSHERKDFWKRKCHGMICYSQLITPDKNQNERQEIEKIIRDIENILCGN